MKPKYKVGDILLLSDSNHEINVEVLSINTTQYNYKFLTGAPQFQNLSIRLFENLYMPNIQYMKSKEFETDLKSLIEEN